MRCWGAWTGVLVGFLAVGALASERDATAELQSALDRGGKVVLTRAGSPWCVKPLQVRSNTEIVFEDGAVLRAATNCYFDSGWCVLNLYGVSNVTIRGKGVIRMNKHEYRTNAYKPGDGRHCISMRGVENVTVEDVTLLDAGADGVYVVGWGEKVPASRNVTLRRVTCDGGWRQGVSVISAENFLAEDCRFVNTKGSSPEAGLDFEPNYPWERLVDCTLRNCEFRNNAGTGLHVSPHQLRDTSVPVSIRIQGCRIVDNGYCGFEVMRNGTGNPPTGECVVENLFVSGTMHHGIVFARKFADMFRVTLKDVTVERTGLKNPDGADVLALSRFWGDNPPGNIVFDNVTIRQTKDRPWFGYAERGLGTEKASGWKGSVKVVSPTKGEKVVKLDAAWMDATFDPPPPKQPPAHVKADFARAKVVDLHPGEMREVSKFHAVWYNWVFYVDRPKTCHFRMRQVPWGDPVLRPSRHPAKIYALTATKGRREWQVPQPTAGAGVVSFEAKEPGFYLLCPITETSKLLLEETDVPVAWYLDAHQGRTFCAAEKASMWFEPTQGRDFALIMSGKDEGVRMELFDPSGKNVWTDPKVIGWNTYVGRAGGRGLWRLDWLAPKVKELWQGYSAVLDVTGMPGCLFLDPDRHWTFEEPSAPVRSLKVLMIGNSYSLSVLREMPNVCADLGLGLDLCEMFIPGCSLARHATNLNAVAERPYLVKGSYASGKGPIGGNQGNIRELLAAERWDVVTLQQASHESWKPESYEPYGTELLAAIRELAPQARVCVQQTWSYTSVSGRLVMWKMDPESMFGKVAAACDGFAKRHGLDVIRMGEAVQRYRRERPVVFETAVWNPEDVVGKKIVVKRSKSDWHAEGDCIHLNDRGEFLQGLVWTAKLFGVDVTKSTYVPKCLADRPDEAALMRKIANELK